MLVLGAGGQLGRDLLGVLAHRSDLDGLGAGRDAVDVADAASVAAGLDGAGLAAGDAVVNCAAFTGVDRAETETAAAFAVNAAGAGHVAAACARRHLALVHLSTDYVFSGTGAHRDPYVETDPPDPRTVYGQSKLEGERLVAERHPGAAIVRTSWLFGVHGANFCQTMLRLGAERDAVDVVEDQVGTPTWTGALAAALADLLASPEPASGLFHLAGRGACSWADLAEELFRRAGVDCEVRRVTSDRVPRPAPRPAWSALASGRADAPSLAPWPDHVAGFVEDRAAIA